MPVEDGSMRRLPPYLVDLCRQMRRAPTETEAWLWECLRNRRLDNYKFRRQQPFGRYIADFCCHEARLIVEIDGPIHDLRADYDRERDAWLATTGNHILRLSTSEIHTDPVAAIQRIRSALMTGNEDQTEPDLIPSPARGEG